MTATMTAPAPAIETARKPKTTGARLLLEVGARCYAVYVTEAPDEFLSSFGLYTPAGRFCADIGVTEDGLHTCSCRSYRVVRDGEIGGFCPHLDAASEAGLIEPSYFSIFPTPDHYHLNYSRLDRMRRNGTVSAAHAAELVALVDARMPR